MGFQGLNSIGKVERVSRRMHGTQRIAGFFNMDAQDKFRLNGAQLAGEDLATWMG